MKNKLLIDASKLGNIISSLIGRPDAQKKLSFEVFFPIFGKKNVYYC